MPTQFIILSLFISISALGCNRVSPEKNREISNLAGPASNDQLLQQNEFFNPSHQQTQRFIQGLDARTQ